jgi:hypothetical protein
VLPVMTSLSRFECRSWFVVEVAQPGAAHLRGSPGETADRVVVVVGGDVALPGRVVDGVGVERQDSDGLAVFALAERAQTSRGRVGVARPELHDGRRAHPVAAYGETFRQSLGRSPPRWQQTPALPTVGKASLGDVRDGLGRRAIARAELASRLDVRTSGEADL